MCTAPHPDKSERYAQAMANAVKKGLADNDINL
jgi:hypothetical protein